MQQISYEFATHAGSGWWKEHCQPDQVLSTLAARVKERTGAGEVIIRLVCSQDSGHEA